MSNLDGIREKTQFTKANARENGRKGGIASGKSKQFAKTFREAAEVELSKTIERKSGDKVNGMEAVVGTLMREAVGGNIRAIELLVKLMGEMTDKVEVSGKDGKDLFGSMSDEELSDKIKKLNEKLKKCEQ